MAKLRRAILLALVTLFAASTARAQVEPPPATSPPPPATSPPPSPPPAAGSSAPVTPLSPTLAPEQAPAPPLVLTERTAQEQPAPRPQPFYLQTWFWAAVGLVAVTTTIILVVSLRDPRDPPDTTFGNMHAF